MCRWLERDPAGYQDGPSLYSYLGRNPMAGTDPYGLFYSGSGITVIAPDQIRPPLGAGELVNPPGYGLRPTLLAPDMPGYNEVVAWVEALSAVAKSNAERGVDYRRDQSVFSWAGAFEGARDGAINFTDRLTFGLIGPLNERARRIRTEYGGSRLFGVADGAAQVGSFTLQTLVGIGLAARAGRLGWLGVKNGHYFLDMGRGRAAAHMWRNAAGKMVFREQAVYASYTRLIPFIVVFPSRVRSVTHAANCLHYAAIAAVRATFYHEGVAAAFPTAAGLFYLIERIRAEHDVEANSAPASIQPAQQFGPGGP
jgi:hypothetical protein